MAGKVDVTNYSINLKINDNDYSINGTTGIEFKTLADINELKFNFQKLDVLNCLLDGQNTPFNYDNNLITINTSVSLPTGLTHNISINYSGRPKDGLIIKKNKYGNFCAFSDNWANRARNWFPSVDHPSDKATVSFNVTVPNKYRVIANGALVKTAVTGDEITFTYKMDVLTPTYCMVIGVCKFSVAETKTASGIPIYSYTYPEDSLNAVKGFQKAADIVNYYESVIGPYPFTKLALVESSTIFGGMENSSAIFFPENSRAFTDKGNDEETVAHEIAHQWFGDDVTESDWSELWLSEGFATYFQMLYYEKCEGTEKFNELVKNTRTNYLNHAGGVPVINRHYKNLFSLLNAENYQKGALFLHALRKNIGDDAFFKGIKEYYQKFKHSNVTTGGFKGVMQDVSNKNLTVLFDEWLNNTGLPAE